MKFKIDEMVRIMDDNNSYYDMVGKIIDITTFLGDTIYSIIMPNDITIWLSEDDLELVEDKIKWEDIDRLIELNNGSDIEVVYYCDEDLLNNRNNEIISLSSSDGSVSHFTLEDIKSMNELFGNIIKFMEQNK